MINLFERKFGGEERGGVRGGKYLEIRKFITINKKRDKLLQIFNNKKNP